MLVFRILAALLVGFFVAWTAVAFQHVAESGSSLGALSVAFTLFGFAALALLSLRLVV